MRIGLLWYDDDPKTTLEQKVARAVARHLKKYGSMPDCCCVNPVIFDGRDKLSVGPVEVVPCHETLLHHFWVGCVEERAQQTRQVLPRME